MSIQVKPGDIVTIKHPEKNSLVKAGKIQLRVPDSMFAVVPNTITKRDLLLLDSLVDWDILVVNNSPVESFSVDEDIEEYENLNVNDALDFINAMNALCSERATKLLEYEGLHKNRKTILKAFKMK